MIGQLGQITVNIADNIMVGALGAEALAALSLSLSLYVVFYIVAFGLAVIMQPLVSEADGAGRDGRVSSYFKHGLIINLLMAFACIAIVETCLPLIYHMGQTPEVVELAIPYLRINTWSLIPFMIFFSFRGLSEGLGETKPPMIAMLVGNAINIGLNYLLIYGHFGAPALGVTGAAIGTFIARSSMMLLVIFLMWKWDSLSQKGRALWTYVREFSRISVQSPIFKKMLSLGLPSAMQMFFEITAFVGAAILMGMIGPEEQAAHQITINAISATFMICVGLSMAASIRVGNALGRKDDIGMRKAGISALLQVFFFMMLCGVSFYVFRYAIPSIYIADEQVIEVAGTLFVIAALFQLSDGIQVTAIGALRGMQDINYPTWVTFFAYLCIGLPFSYVAAFQFDLGYIGIWIGLLIGLSLSAWLNTRRFLRLSTFEDMAETKE